MSGEGGIPNGSFEIDADSDGVPDGWTKNLYPAGGGSLETTSPMHGAAAYKFIQQAGPGNGGGDLDQNDYLACSPSLPLTFEWLHYASAAGMKNIVQVRWFDKSKVYLSTTDLYNSTSNPTSATWMTALAIPPAMAQFFKLRIIGGYTDTDIAGTAYFDGFGVLRGIPRSGALWQGITEYYGEPGGGYPTFTDRGSVSIPLPSLSATSLVRISVVGWLKTSNTSFTAYMRFRIGTWYSSEFSAESVSYVVAPCTFAVPIPGLSGSQTLYMQLSNEDGGIYSGGKVDPGKIVVEILNP
ncbi:MAG: hypothetical protein A2Z03_07785 [Chloroflexi bacterium RBG_16_56_8]|nr:MAG: hypothetical protein A2Z03_07785 [Chloroflexi bacterium RBG_16_56_8]